MAPEAPSIAAVDAMMLAQGVNDSVALVILPQWHVLKTMASLKRSQHQRYNADMNLNNIASSYLPAATASADGFPSTNLVACLLTCHRPAEVSSERKRGIRAWQHGNVYLQV